MKTSIVTKIGNIASRISPKNKNAGRVQKPPSRGVNPPASSNPPMRSQPSRPAPNNSNQASSLAAGGGGDAHMMSPEEEMNAALIQ